MTEKASDLWQTPAWLFQELDQEFKFDYDVCANENNALKPCKGDYFKVEYKDCVCFMNPPYSSPARFVERALKLRHKGVTTVCLLKADTGTKLFSLVWDREQNNPKSGIEVRFLEGRIKFNHPNPDKNKGWTGTFPSMVVIIYAR